MTKIDKVNHEGLVVEWLVLLQRSAKKSERAPVAPAHFKLKLGSCTYECYCPTKNKALATMSLPLYQKLRKRGLSTK
jgi:hypothetical protein